MKKIVAVTGGNGFIGKRVVDMLVAQGFGVKVLIHKKKRGINKNAILVAGNIENKKDIIRLIDGADYLVNLAAIMDPECDVKMVKRVNTQAVKTMLDLIESKPIKMVQVSSVMVFADTLDKERDESWIRRDKSKCGIYELSKILADQIVENHPKKIVTVYPSIVLKNESWLDKSRKPKGLIGVVWEIVGGGIPGGLMAMIGPRNRWRNIVELDDVVEGIVGAMKNGVEGEGYILGGQNITSGDYLDSLRKLARTKYGWKIRIPEWPFKLVKLSSSLIKWPKILYSISQSLPVNMKFSSEKAHKQWGYIQKWKLR